MHLTATSGSFLIRVLLLICAAFLASCSHHSSKTPTNRVADTSNMEAASLSILQNPGVEHLKAMLALVVQDRLPGSTSQQHFFVTKYKDENSSAYLFWKEGQLLWIFTPGDETEETWMSIRYPSGGRLLDLRTDVVADDSVGSSTYLVGRTWAQERIYDAVVDGDLIVITPDQQK